MTARGDKAVSARGLGGRLRTLRAARGMTRRILSRDSGVSERYLAQLESDRANPSLLVLERVAGAIGVGLPELLFARPPGAAALAGLLDALDPDDLAEAKRMLEARFAPAPDRSGRIALIGLRGAGKTTLGRALARRLGCPFVELSREIERDCGKPVGELLASAGQPALRRHERRALARVVAAHGRAVIATPGGIVAEPRTRDLLFARTHGIWLTASPGEHMARVAAQGDDRPMADNRDAMRDLRATLDARAPAYARAEARVDTSGRTVPETLETLLAQARRLLRENALHDA